MNKSPLCTFISEISQISPGSICGHKKSFLFTQFHMSTAVVQVANSFISVQLFSTQPVMTGFVINTFLSLDIWLLYTKRKITLSFSLLFLACTHCIIFSRPVLMNCWAHHSKREFMFWISHTEMHTHKCIWSHKESGATSIFTAMTAFTVVFHTRFLSLFHFFLSQYITCW